LGFALCLSSWRLSKKKFGDIARNRFPAGFQAGKVLNFCGWPLPHIFIFAGAKGG